MDSNRTSGHVEILMPCQTYDPAKGSFMVHPVAVKAKNGMFKEVRNPNFDEELYNEPYLPVFRAANHIKGYDRNGARMVEAHPEAFDFAVDYSRR